MKLYLHVINNTMSGARLGAILVGIFTFLTSLKCADYERS